MATMYGTTARPVVDDASHQQQHQPNEEEKTFKQKLYAFYERNFGLFLVFLAQTCGTVMNTAAKVLTDSSVEFHALQIIFVRMLCTTLLGSAYMWYNRVPDFPLGQKGIKRLLVLRGSAGFVGLFGLYYSLSWLAISDATVITFLIPTMTAFVCFLWLREPFTLHEASAGLLAFTGVLFVARPPWLFPSAQADSAPTPTSLLHATLAPDASTPDTISPTQRTIATCIAILGTAGASTAYATIRVIGTRAHSLISVNYFAFIATVGSALGLLIHPALHFTVPHGALQWSLIAIIGLTGFLLQFLLTEGLQREKAGRATNLTYLQLVFALVVERVIWGSVPPLQSFVGAGLIIAAAVWVSLQKQAQVGKEEKVQDEERRLLGEEREE